MKKENFYIAVYIDMENVCGIDFSLESIMKSCMKSENDDFNFIFAIKAAYGNQSSMPKAFKKSVVEHNFNIIDTPHISAQKNRADLLMSLDAFETLYLDTPRIDRYCFMTSDSDFTVIGDRLRKFGREVWLACRTADNPIESLFIEALSYVNINKLPMNVSVINDRMKMLDPSFDVSKTPYRRFNNLVEAMQQNGHLKVEFDIRSNRVIEVNIT
ncbi:NYN domain-containing protein [Aliivibrio fischeri]|uniref:NYN domain-containing protein n=1 Tax=Aliivibrio fischeri TaxID=668 RepID=UPI0007C5AFDE|nr:NYN domain-containing protein [Aliivibrio fischeri]